MTYTVFTNGCFDILHRGHLKLLEHCRRARGPYDQTVIVGLNSDASVRRLKGKSRPFNNEKDRKYYLESLKYVDRVIIFDEDTPQNLIQKIKPDLIVKEKMPSREEVGDYKVELFEHVEGYSTTDIINEIISNRR